jgi:putative nucleotidyltransferase with HDIG domain
MGRETILKMTSHEWGRFVLAVAVTVAFVAYFLIAPFLIANSHDLGFTTEVDASGNNVVNWVLPNGPAYDQDIQYGDRVLSISELPGGGKVALISSQSDPTAVREISVRSGSGLEGFQKFSFLLLAIIFIGVGGPVYVKAQYRSAASAFYLFCIASALSLVTLAISETSTGWSLALMFISLATWAASFACFFLKFPLKVGKRGKLHGSLIGAIAITGLAIISFYLYTYFVNPWLYPAVQLANFTYLAVCTLIGLVSLGRAFFIQRSKLVQGQLSVVLVGTMLAVGPSLVLGVLPKFVGIGTVDIQYTALTLGIMPISLAYAITQHQLLGIRGLVRRSVVHGVMGFAVLLALTALAITLSALLPNDWYKGEVGLVAVGLFVLLIASSYGYVQRKVEVWADKFIYHDGYDYKEALLNFSAQLSTEQDLNRLTDDLVERTCRLMNLTCGILLLADQRDGVAGHEEGLVDEEGVGGIRSGKKPAGPWGQNTTELERTTAMRVVPYSRYGAGADWLIEGLQKELAEYGVVLDDESAPMEMMYFSQRMYPHETFESTHLSMERVMETANLQKNIRSFLGVPLWTRQHFIGILCLGSKRTGERFSKDDLDLLSTLGGHAALAIYNAQLFEAQREALLGTIEALAHAIEAKDGYTIRHCERMTERAWALAQVLQLSDKEAENIRMGAILHDIGKIGIADSILNKPARLTPEEYEIMKEHTVIGARIVQSVGALTDVVPIVRHHHERYDGKGYPGRLRGANIPLGARIIAVVDTYGAMTEDRVYRMAPGHYKAIEELQKLKGEQFDPEVVDAFLRLMEVRPDLAEMPVSQAVVS